MRNNLKFSLDNVSLLKQNILRWASNFKCCCYFDSCNANSDELNPNFSNYDCIVAVDKLDELQIINENEKSLQQLKEFHLKHQDWLFGFLSYDIKNEIEDLHSNNSDHLNFPILCFFQAKLIFLVKENVLTIEFFQENYSAEQIKNLYEEINNYQLSIINYQSSIVNFTPKISREVYLEKIQLLKQHIQSGDIYEINFCQEFYTKTEGLDPVEIYTCLKKKSPTPFSVYYRWNDQYLMCASPERFLMKKGNKVISQPIKGTSKRGNNLYEDESLKTQLFTDQKERSENIMIVDLVRNDLSKIAKKGSVKVEELCKIYSYQQVHQMVSTISAQIEDSFHFTDVIHSCFPMGSMTGAPKIKAMELIEKFESTKRGLFSGSVGYISPQGDFDFNVVIRSLFYNASNQYLSYMVGSAITAKSIPENEYKECLLKGKAIIDVLSKKHVESE